MQQLWIHLVQNVADLIVGGQLVDAEDGGGVVEVMGLLHQVLMSKKGRALAVEGGKGRHREIQH